ncbi:toprim domain-containing protein [Spirosoma oryzicola]|uniref:toprim domain-containing protein n=1 Tax=Spirosoma oryzicola TaxID=2898794 RepID=UPI001E4AD912|nr:toprim domain-containing protein [Spirosoma oryzicola]UHG94701.1 toprim domain-containing protein [Spirosoma oryzicola]
MTKFDELKERFPNLIPVQELRANVSIVELAIQYGYEPQLHKGKSRPVLEHPTYKDTIIIKNPQDASTQVYQRAGDFTDSGTIIDFVRNRLSTVFSTFNRPGEHEFRNITSVLYDYLRIDPNHINQNRKATGVLSDAGPKQQFAKEQFDIRALESNNYLTKRNIAPQTIDRPEFAKKVVAQIAYFNPETGHTDGLVTVKEHPERKYLTFTNVAFPYYNGLSSEITGLELRNENIKLHAPGSDRFSSVFISNPPPKPERFYIMESAIDALSHQQLRSIKGDDKFNAVYFSTGGQLSPQQVNTITRYITSFDKSPDWSINLGFDNDVKGHRFDLQFIQQLIATKFPMSPTTGGINRVSYLLPEGESHQSIQKALLGRIDAYNQNVQAQFVSSDQDKLGQQELTTQQIVISRSGNQIAVSIPESAPALSAFSRDLLELTGYNQRIAVSKACGKDFNEDLTRQVRQGQRYKYSIVDEAGHNLYNGNVANLMAKTLSHLKHQAEGDGQNKTFTIMERLPFGFQRPQAVLKVEKGEIISATQTPEFNKQLQLEKNQRSGLDTKQERKILNPESKPVLGQSPQPPQQDDQPKLKR